MKVWQADLAIIGAGTIWGLAYVFTRWGLSDCSPSLFLLTRFALALFVSLLLFGRSLKGLSSTTAWRGIILGFYMGSGYLLQNYSVNFTEVSRAAFIGALTLPAIPVVSFILFREKIKLNNFIGIVLALIGLYLLLDPQFSGLNIGDLVAFLSIPFWALYLIYINVYTEGNDEPYLTERLLILQFVGAIPLVALCSIIFESGLTPALHPDLVKGLNPSGQFWAGLIYCAILASIVIVFIQTACQKHTTPVQAMICFQVEPVMATIGAFFFLNEPINLKMGIGALIIILGVLTSEIGSLLISKKEED
ncbi:MAG: DMT family transporter [Deltaproteobacteria bacterium]|jgi:drug/metabolite transporter (DMT)-like permease|nr:DMT family transporter [Deltaproteobacteria bacterium]